jgi:hypothetical protein
MEISVFYLWGRSGVNFREEIFIRRTKRWANLLDYGWLCLDVLP